MKKIILSLILSGLLLTGCGGSLSKTDDGDPSNVGQVAENTLAAENQSGLSQNDREMVLWDGEIEHIFFHPLIIYPEKAFDGSYRERGFDDWMITRDEMFKIFVDLYERNFILVNATEAFVEIDGTWQRNPEFKVPEGLKPLIITIDDLSYNEVYQGNGYSEKLVLNADGQVTAQYLDGDEVKEGRDYEIATYINQFVEEYPDFSLNNARGVLALTGYEGILGYRTQVGADNRDEEIRQAQLVADQLKKDGWLFSSHSYGHNNLPGLSLETLETDTIDWLDEVGSIVGETTIYTLPFGNMPTGEDRVDKAAILTDLGFHIIFSVGYESYIEPNDDHPEYILQDRRAIDGFSMRLDGRLDDLIDVDEVFSEFRKENPVGPDNSKS